MTDADRFLAAICAEPERDDIRLVFADWLEERGDPRGEFIRLQCALAVDEANQHRGIPAEQTVPCQACVHFGALRLRERALLDAYGSFAPWIVPDPAIVLDDWTFHRGFVEAVTLPASAWLEHADAILRAAPVREVTLTTFDVAALGTALHLLSNRGLDDYSGPIMDMIAEDMLVQLWPGIRFTLP